MTDLLARRAAVLGPNLPTFYDDPVHLVRGQDVWLWDADGNRYLDCYNNVPHVGHCNPRVVKAIADQAATLNTHTRYLHDGIVDYAERLTALFADPLEQVILTCTGSEANDIALRMAEAVTGKRGIIATDATYHGNTALVSHLSRSNVPGVGFGLEQFLHWVPAPDSLRGTITAQGFADAVAQGIKAHEDAGHGFGALLLCPYFVNEGFPDLPPGWLDATIDVVRKAGGIIIADEVQPGFGRIGSHMWGHEFQGFVPDIVTLGKPMANGHPVGAVVTSADTMAAFRNAFRYFNTFGGNPVSCAAAMATLDELQSRDLMRQAHTVGTYARERLTDLAGRHEVIGNVRGAGMLFGAEMVSDRTTNAPATAYTAQIVNALRHRGVLLSALGRARNTLKIRPPMTFGQDHVDLLMNTLDAVLTEIPAHG